ncbi:alpha/beta-hydrolase [Trametes gibbosa]|nr:alpha/beta-hydrolase [Trametes gibbosa]
MVNSLTRQAGLKLGPIILDVLVKHYFERLSKDHEAKDMPKLMQEELLYDEAFNIVKSFMEAATKHTVEELQEFSNTRTPSPPWVHVVRLLVPMPCCDEAASYLIKAMGGEEVTKRVVGGTKWWQVRGLKGIDAEWIVAKKDWQEAKRRQKARETSTDGGTPSLDTAQQEVPATYQPEMDEMRCILYAHGGGYYFGSFDQERYVMQRLARKINGRVFAINYRLAPQYPFPCAPQDFLAAYLYLIRPPPGALHTPVLPSNIVLAGDSAGGGLCIALLQVIRDSGLPAPSGAVLISPWCDLTHSFPSIHLNTATDIIPQYGLSFHKPSTLWPPPPDDLNSRVRQSLRSRIRDVLHHGPKDGKDAKQHDNLSTSEKKEARCNSPPPGVTNSNYTVTDSSTGRSLHLGSVGTLPMPLDGMRTQHVSLATSEGETLSIDGQIHMYAPNYLLMHPLVSPVVSYLGGLPPMLVIASDKEVIRDEIIYFAHKATHPEQYPVKPEARLLYPALEGIEERYGPTKVHLQVYDDAAHTLPVLFAFTTPGKYCFRAMATFIKYITGMLPMPNGGMPTVLEDAVRTFSPPGSHSNLPAAGTNGNASRTLHTLPVPTITASRSDPSVVSGTCLDMTHSPTAATSAGSGDTFKANDSKSPPSVDGMSARRAFSARITRASVFLRRQSSTISQSSSPSGPHGQARDSTGSSDVAGPRFHEKSSGPEGVRYAGELAVYDNGLDTMIRERVSTRGVIRALEPESELSAFRIPPKLVGEVSERALRRYIDGNAKFAKKFGKTAKAIEKARRRTLERAKQDTLRNMGQLQTFLNAGRDGEQDGAGQHGYSRGHPQGCEESSERVVREETPGSWAWAWALDADEHPPPSSIVARRDTEEARRLAKIADQAVFMDEHAVSGNNLWSLIVNFLTINSERDGHKHHHGHGHDHAQQQSDMGKGKAPRHQEQPLTSHDGEKGQAAGGEGITRVVEKRSRREHLVSKFAQLVAERRKSRGSAAVAHDKAGK